MVTLDPMEFPKETFPQSTGLHSEGKLWPSQVNHQEGMSIKGIAWPPPKRGLTSVTMTLLLSVHPW